MKINKTALTSILKLKKDALRFRLIASCSLVMGVSIALSHQRSGEPITGTKILIFAALLILAVYFMFVVTYKKQILVLKNIVEEIDVQDGKGVFRIGTSEKNDERALSFTVGQLKMVLPTKEEIGNFRGKYFIVFSLAEGRIYLVEDYWDDFHAILGQLELKEESLIVVKPAPYFSIMRERGVDLKYQFYSKCVYIVVFTFAIAYMGSSIGISFLSNLIGCLCFAAFLGALTISPLLSKIKVISHLVLKMDIKDNCCYFYCRNVFKEGVARKAYHLNEIVVAEWEVYQEVFFKDEKFLVLGAHKEKFYLVGELLAEYGKAFTVEQALKQSPVKVKGDLYP